MPLLFTPRLWLLPLTRPVMDRRLQTDDFSLELATPAGVQTVHFSPQWPGDVLPAFPFFFTQLRDGVLPGSFIAVEQTSAAPAPLEAVGMLGTKGKLSAAGEQEIGYGFNPAAWGQGYATEATQALISHLLETADVRTVTAQTALSNRASERVLEKSGFRRSGTGRDEQHGELTLWAYTLV